MDEGRPSPVFGGAAADAGRRGAEPAPAAGSAPPGFDTRTPLPRSPKRRAKFAVGGLVIVLAISGLIAWAMTRAQSTAFDLTVGEVMAGAAAAPGESFRVNGNVVPGSLEEEGVTTRFEITDDISDESNRLTIVTDEPLPDAFWSAYENDASNIEVIAQGNLEGDGSTFTASKVLAKCPSKFKTRA